MSKRMRGAYESEDIKSANGTIYRVCRFCGKSKPLSEFGRNGKDATGAALHRKDCKVCYNVRRKENKAKKAHSDFIGSSKRRGESNVAYSHEQWKQTCIFFEGRCAYCGRTMRKGERLTRDHLVPVAEGGLTCQSNIVPACSSCNSSKGARDWHDWYMKQPFFSQEAMNHIFRWRSIMRASGEE
jgi:5-methylcytosine-specific restriction endonuclease McrA